MTKNIVVFRIAGMLASLSLVVGACAQDRVNGGDAPQLLTVMTSGSFAPALAVLAPRFERETDVSLVIVRGASVGDSPTSIPSRLAADEYADVVILSRDALDQLTAQGQVRAETSIDLARSRIAMAVKTGAHRPDISTVEAFVETVLQAESFGYSGSVSGTYLTTEVFPDLGIWEAIRSKGTRVTDEPVAARVARGEVEIGFQQVSELLTVDGVDLVGPLPPELQLVTTFSAAVTARSVDPAGARTLIDFLASEAVADDLARMGLEPAVLEGRH